MIPQPPKVSFLEARARFRNQSAMAKHFGVSRASVSEWKQQGYLPPLRAMQFRQMPTVGVPDVVCNHLDGVTDSAN